MIGFFTAMALSIGSQSTARAALKRDVSVFATTARRARADAIALGAPIDLIVDVATASYDAGSAGEGSIAGGAITELVTAKELMSGAARGVIRFYADGSTSGGRIVITAESARFTIVVDWLTGAVSLRQETAK